MSQDRCSICNHDERDRLEELGQQALDGAISWRAAARDGDLSHHQSLKNHMEKHYALPPSEEELLMGAVSEDIAEMIEGLKQQARIAPPEIAPFYAIAIRNLAAIENTAPSQQHLIQALKAIHEVTGMKMEQRLMLEFAKASFGSFSEPEPVAGEVEQRTGVIDV